MVNHASENKEWPIGLRQIGRIPVQTPLGPQVGFGTQPCYEARVDHWVKSRIKCSDEQWVNEAASSTVVKVGLGEAKWQLKKTFLGFK